MNVEPLQQHEPGQHPHKQCIGKLSFCLQQKKTKLEAHIPTSTSWSNYCRMNKPQLVKLCCISDEPGNQLQKESKVLDSARWYERLHNELASVQRGLLQFIDACSAALKIWERQRLRDRDSMVLWRFYSHYSHFRNGTFVNKKFENKKFYRQKSF